MPPPAATFRFPEEGRGSKIYRLPFSWNFREQRKKKYRGQVRGFPRTKREKTKLKGPWKCCFQLSSPYVVFFRKWKRQKGGGPIKTRFADCTYVLLLFDLSLSSPRIHYVLWIHFTENSKHVFVLPPPLSLFFAGIHARAGCDIPPSPPTLSYLKIQDGKREEEEEGGPSLWPCHLYSACAQIIYTYVADAGAPRFGAKKVRSAKKNYCCHSKEKCYVTGGPKKAKRMKKTSSVFLLPTGRSSKSFPDRIGGEKLYWHEFA